MDHGRNLAHSPGPMKVLVTGASGFVGSGLIAELNRRGIRPRALLRKSSAVTNLANLDFDRVEGSLGDEASLRTAVRGCDAVFHVAGVVTAPSEAEFLEHNAVGAERLARAVAEECPGLGRFVLVSSLAAAGPAGPGAPRTESEPEAPVSAYGRSKWEGEKRVLQLSHRIPITVIRPPMVYGPRDQATFLFVKSVKGRLVPAFEKFYSAIHVDDLVRGIADAGLEPGRTLPSGERLFLTREQVFSYSEMMEAIGDCLGKKPIAFPLPFPVLAGVAWGLDGLGKITGRTYPLNRDKLNEIRPDHWTCSGEKARKLLGFEAKHDIRSGWADAVAWYRSAGWI